jgi:autotransporter-associated beta strand protein
MGTTDAVINSLAISDYKNYNQGDFFFNNLSVTGGAAIWKGAGGDNNAGTSGNWLNGPITSGTPYLVFSGTTRTTPTIDAAYTISGLAFDSGSTSGFTLGVSGSGAFLITTASGNSVGIVNNNSNAETINVPITLGNSQTWNAEKGNLSIGGTVSLGSNVLTIGGFDNAANATHDVTIGGDISGSGGSLVKNDGGTLTLSGNNSYTGGTTLNAGVIKINSATSLGNQSGDLTLSVGTLEVTTNITSSRNIKLSGASDFFQVDPGATYTDTGTFSNISSGGILLKTGSGTLAMNNSSANTYGGDTFVLDGTLQLGTSSSANGSVANVIRLGEVGGTASVTFALANLTGGQTVANIINPRSGTSGTILIDSKNTSNTNIISGNIFLDHDLTMQQASGGTLSITNATLDLKNQTLSLLGNGGKVDITGVIGNSTGGGQLVVGTDGVASSGATVTLSNTNTYGGNTFIRSGILGFTSAGSANNSTFRLGSTTGSNVNAEIDLITAGGGVSLSSIINPVSTSGSGTLKIDSQNTSGNNTLSGHFGVDRDLTINQSSGGTLDITQARSGGAGSDTGFDVKTRTLTLTGGGNINFNDVYNSTGSGAGTIQMSGTGVVTLAGTHDNVAVGAVVDSGTLLLAKAPSSSTVHALGSAGVGITVNGSGTVKLGGSGSDQIFDSTPMKLNGGTFNTGGLSEHGATNNTAGIGALTLQSTSVIDMASGNSIVAFANSSGATWASGQILKIYDWSGTPNTGGGTDQLYFGNSSSGLTSTQLSQVQFYSDAGNTLFGGGSAILLSTGEMVPVPEPSTWVAAALSLGAIAYASRKRLRPVG